MRQAAGVIERFDVQDVVRPTAIFSTGDKTPRMLIVDDDPSVVQLLANHCARMGFDVDTAADGLQALLRASRSKPDILVIDVKMPEVDGLAVCAHLLDADRAPESLIVITGSRDPNALERCKGFGAHYVRKGPKFWDDLEAALVEVHPLMAGRIRQTCTKAPMCAEGD
jgi:CheY-like chemotaxis protein